jgi:hypothetical protein
MTIMFGIRFSVHTVVYFAGYRYTPFSGAKRKSRWLCILVAIDPTRKFVAPVNLLQLSSSDPVPTPHTTIPRYAMV